jgi:hypothetical protein
MPVIALTSNYQFVADSKGKILPFSGIDSTPNFTIVGFNDLLANGKAKA